MKLFSYLLIFTVAISAYSQEFESRFFTIDEASLPAVFLVEESDFVQKTAKLSPSKNLRLTSSNYWRPVSMVDALNREESYLNRKNPTVRYEITAESLGFKREVEKDLPVQVQIYDMHRPTGSGVRNSVYRDASMPFFYNPYHFRTGMGRGF